MKEELYLWIRNLAVFYIFFTAVLNLIPDQKYEKYVRFFMGLLLIFMMSTPDKWWLYKERQDDRQEKCSQKYENRAAK